MLSPLALSWWPPFAGAQHQRRDRFREAPYDTFCFVLQNDAASRQWPASSSASSSAGLPQKLGPALLAAFAEGVPTEAASVRRFKEGRGFGDADGGGGAYRGKDKGKATKTQPQRAPVPGAAKGQGKAPTKAGGGQGGGKPGKGQGKGAQKHANAPRAQQLQLQSRRGVSTKGSGGAVSLGDGTIMFT